MACGRLLLGLVLCLAGSIAVADEWHHWYPASTANWQSGPIRQALQPLGEPTNVLCGSVAECEQVVRDQCVIHIGPHASQCVNGTIISSTETVHRMDIRDQNGNGYGMFLSVKSGCGDLDEETGECSNFPIPDLSELAEAACEAAAENDFLFRLTHTDAAPRRICHDGCLTGAVARTCLSGTCSTTYKLFKAEERDAVGNIAHLWCDDDVHAPTSPITSPVPLQQGDGEHCEVVGGLEVCHGHGEGQCGWYNDSFVCIGQAQPTNCIELADGSRVCAENAPSPPVPDSGTPGVIATPDASGEVTVIESSETGDSSDWNIPFNWFSDMTVSGSHRDMDGTGTVRGDPRGTGTGSGTGTGDGNGDGDGDLGDPGDWEGALGGWGSELSGLAGIADHDWSVGSASCPTAEFEMFGEQMEIGFHCYVIDSASALIAAAFLFGWGILAWRIFWSA